MKCLLIIALALPCFFSKSDRNFYKKKELAHSSSRYIVFFELNSNSFKSAKDTLVLDQIANIYKELDSNYFIVIEHIFCEKELKLNNCITMQRSDKIINYLNKKFSINKNVFNIVPYATTAFGHECDLVGANIILTKN